MYKTLIVAGIVLLAGCASRDYHSPYDLNRDGTLDARCPGVSYDTTRHTWYGWRSKASVECNRQDEDSA